MSITNLLFKEAGGYLKKEAKNLGKEGKQRLHSSTGSNTGAIIGAALAGLAVGAVLGILFAPDRGTETRNSIAGSVKDLGNTVADKARQGKDKITDLTDKAMDAIKSRTQSQTSTSPETEPVA